MQGHFWLKKKKKKWMAFLHSKHASTHFIINISYEKHYQKCSEIFYSEWFFFIARGFHLMVFFHFTTDKKQICLNPSLISSTGSFIYFYFFFETHKKRYWNISSFFLQAHPFIRRIIYLSGLPFLSALPIYIKYVSKENIIFIWVY